MSKKRFKSHNCRVIDTKHAMDSEGKLVRGGVKQSIRSHKLPGSLRRRAFVHNG